MKMKIQSLSSNIHLDPEQCKGETPFIDCHHPAILQVIGRLKVRDLPGEEQRAAALFRYVRDEIHYEFVLKMTPDEYRASYVLGQGRGFCVQKAVLLAALGRAAGIPVALVVTDLIDYTLSDELAQAMGTNILYHHGLNAFFLKGRWISADASLSADLIKKKSFRLVEFDGRQDAFLSTTTLDGRPHAEYDQVLGVFADLDFSGMMAIFAAAYRNADLERIKSILTRRS